MKPLLATAVILLTVVPVQAKERLGLPKSQLTVSADQYVLAPPQNWVQSARDKGFNKQSFIFYAATVQTVGDKEASLVNLARVKHTVPNALVVPIQPGQRAKTGDIVLTWWQSGSGMQRAIVVGGTPTEPVVRYLDISWTNPTGAAKKDAKLKPDTFHVLSKPMQPGTAVMVRGKGQQRHGLVISRDKQQIAVLGFGGKLAVYPIAAVEAIPVHPTVKSGDRVLVPVFGSMKEAAVTKVDARNGRVFVNYKFGSRVKEEAVPFGNVVSAAAR